MPTRLPYGLSYVKPGAKSSEYMFTAGDTTPDVSLGTFFQIANSGITITNFDGGERGKAIFIYSGSGSVATIQNSAGGINVFGTIATNSAGFLNSATTGNYLMANRETLMFMHNGTDWSQVSPSLRVP